MRKRGEILDLLATLPPAAMADDDELMDLMEEHRLYGRGLGWVDIHLLGSGLLSSCKLWTADKAIREATHRPGIAAIPGEAR